MASVKVTFTLDQPTVALLEQSAARLGVPKSQVVREAIGEYYERIGRLSESERVRLLRVFDEVLPRIPGRPAGAVDRELRSIRQARRGGGRRGGTRRAS